MTDYRKGEPQERHFRSDRVVMARGRWYVVTRERIDVGRTPRRRPPRRPRNNWPRRWTASMIPPSPWH